MAFSLPGLLLGDYLPFPLVDGHVRLDPLALHLSLGYSLGKEREGAREKWLSLVTVNTPDGLKVKKKKKMDSPPQFIL